MNSSLLKDISGKRLTHKAAFDYTPDRDAVNTKLIVYDYYIHFIHTHDLVNCHCSSCKHLSSFVQVL